MRRAAGTTLTMILALALTPIPASGWDGTEADQAVQVRVGGFRPSGDGRFWKESEELFTQEVADFNAAIVGFSFVGSLANSVELGVNLDFYDATNVSVYRDFVEEVEFSDGSVEFFDIAHDTRLEIVPLTVDFRFLPGGRYRIRGPDRRRVRKPVFYVGGGAGLTFWEYEEVGDFVFEDEFVDFDRFSDRGAALELHGLIGVEFPLNPRFNLLLEARHSWSEDDLGGDFSGLSLGEIDLGGLSAYVGGSFRF